MELFIVLTYVFGLHVCMRVCVIFYQVDATSATSANQPNMRANIIVHSTTEMCPGPLHQHIYPPSAIIYLLLQ